MGKHQIRHVENIPWEAGHCGLRKRLVVKEDGCGLAVSHLEISSAKRHRHVRSTEIYYVISGTGEIVLDGCKRTIRSGDTIIIPPGTVHSASSEDSLKILIIMIPPGAEDEDLVAE